jgi:hypothetical protein
MVAALPPSCPSVASVMLKAARRPALLPINIWEKSPFFRSFFFLFFPAPPPLLKICRLQGSFLLGGPERRATHRATLEVFLSRNFV